MVINMMYCLSTCRKLLKKAKVHTHKLMPYLNDTLVIDSLLLKAGIKTLGDRLDIITTLKTIDRGNTETCFQGAGPPSPLGIGSWVQDDSDAPMSQMPNPHAHAQLVQFP